MNRGLGRESPHRTGEPPMALIGCFMCGCRSRVQIKWNIEVLHRRPEITVLRKVIEQGRIGGVDFRVSVDERATEPQLVDAPRKLLSRSLGILERERSESFETF